MRNVFFRGSNLFTLFYSKSVRKIQKKCSHKIFNFCGLKVKVQEIQLDNQAGYLTWYFRLSLMFYPLYKISNKLPKVMYRTAKYYNLDREILQCTKKVNNR